MHRRPIERRSQNPSAGDPLRESPRREFRYKSDREVTVMRHAARMRLIDARRFWSPPLYLVGPLRGRGDASPSAGTVREPVGTLRNSKRPGTAGRAMPPNDGPFPVRYGSQTLQQFWRVTIACSRRFSDHPSVVVAQLREEGFIRPTGNNREQRGRSAGERPRSAVQLQFRSALRPCCERRELPPIN